jgi:hypothetical protein
MEDRLCGDGGSTYPPTDLTCGGGGLFLNEPARGRRVGSHKKGISMPSLHVEVRDDEIIVTQSGSKFRAVYHSVHHKPEDQPQLIVKGTPHGNYDFLAGQ